MTDKELELWSADRSSFNGPSIDWIMQAFQIDFIKTEEDEENNIAWSEESRRVKNKRTFSFCFLKAVHYSLKNIINKLLLLLLLLTNPPKKLVANREFFFFLMISAFAARTREQEVGWRRAGRTGLSDPPPGLTGCGWWHFIKHRFLKFHLVIFCLLLEKSNEIFFFSLKRCVLFGFLVWCSSLAPQDTDWPT